MAQALPTGYAFDPEDPRAPTAEQWARMSTAERARVVDTLPASLPIELCLPEGDAHRKAKEKATSALDDFFRRAGRRIYLSSELAVFYPGERSFAPDLIAVLDVDPHERRNWTVAVEGKGLDFVLEVHVAGDRDKDLVANVERYARLGIPEYFVFDKGRARLHAHRLPAGDTGKRARAYERMVPQAGRFSSAVLGLDLVLDGDRLRFFAGNAPLEDSEEIIARLGSMLDKVIAREESLAAELEEKRLQLEESERRLAEALAEIERLKKG